MIFSNGGGNICKNVFNIPYIMYYTLLRTYTTNIYTLPYLEDFTLRGSGYDGFTSSENLI
jgi:hypothetical protein